MLSLVLAALVFTLALVPAGMAQAKKPLIGAMDLTFVGHLGPIFDGEGRLLTWVGTISGDINGAMKFWGVLGTPTTGQVFHFIERWEIWDGEELLLAGDDAGTVTVRHAKNTNYRMNGEVLEASGDFSNLIGRHVHMSGHIIWAIPGLLPGTGPGIFRIN